MTKTMTEDREADQPVNEDSYRLIPITKTFESETNPRSRFDPKAMEDMIASVRQHGVIQPILVRARANSGDVAYEVVAGARRFRASKALRLDTIPAIVRQMSDKEVVEVQFVENLQRQDLHPLEEARGYNLLIKDHGYNADDLAKKIGKSASYIFGRRKLLEMPKKAQDLFEAGEIDASCALLVARIPDQKMALEAAMRIAGKDDDGRPMSFREAKEMVQMEYMLRLEDAPFPTGDPSLVPEAGPCGTCPKRTGNAKDLFGDVKDKQLCTDPKCFERKLKAGWEIAKAEAKKKQQPVIDIPKSGDFIDVRMMETCDLDPKEREWGKLLKGVKVVKTLVRDPSLHYEEVIGRDDAIAALKASGIDFAKEKKAKSGDKDDDPAKHKQRMAVVKAAIPKVVECAENGSNQGMKFLRYVAEQLIANPSTPIDSVVERRGVKAKDLVDACRTEAKLRGLIVEMIAMRDPSNRYTDGYGVGWNATIKFLKLSMRDLAKLAKVEKKAKEKKAKKGVAAK